MQRYRCTKCGTAFSAEQPLSGVRIEQEKAVQVIALLVEGMGIRAISRFLRIDQKTVLNILESMGQQCARFLDERIRNVQVDSVQVDEMFTFCSCKEKNNIDHDYNKGSQYLFLGIDSKSKLILNHVVGKRDSGNANELIADLNLRVAGRFQLTTDGFEPYRAAVHYRLGDKAEFAQLIKLYHNPQNGIITERRYSPTEFIGTRIEVYSGNPDREKISTSHVERTNLSVRLFNRRFTRLSLGYSKQIRFLRHSVAIMIAHFDFCRVHSAHSMTPAQAAGLANRAWSIEELVKYTYAETVPPYMLSQQSSPA